MARWGLPGVRLTRRVYDAATGACPEMTGLAALVGDFAALLRPNTGNDASLNRWIEQARSEELPHLDAFTRGLQLDRQPVDAAVNLPFHNGRTEGVNTTTKLMKRQMYGRRRLHPPPSPHPPRPTPPNVTTEYGREPLDQHAVPGRLKLIDSCVRSSPSSAQPLTAAAEVPTDGY